MALNVAENVQKSAKDFAEKSKNDEYERKIKKYNPLFPDKYHSTEFNLPNMIVIVDDAVYYVDRFDRSRFIQTECIFTKAHEERLAELKNIAYMLGAKYCSIEISESSSQMEAKKKHVEAKLGAKGFNATSTESATQESAYEGHVSRSGKIEAKFEGSEEVKRPDLKWFMHDDTIKRLVDMRCENKNAIKSETLILEGSSSATMSKKTACAIDNAVGKIGVSGNANMEGQALKEERSKLIFMVEF